MTREFARCRIHHVDDWFTGGPTDLRNLVPLCDRHHRLAHEGGWTLRLADDRTLTVHMPDGREFATRPLARPAAPHPSPDHGERVAIGIRNEPRAGIPDP